MTRVKLFDSIQQISCHRRQMARPNAKSTCAIKRPIKRQPICAAGFVCNQISLCASEFKFVQTFFGNQNLDIELSL